MRDGDGHDAHHRGHDVAQAVAPEHAGAAQALGAGQQHIIAPYFVQQLVADHVGVIPQVAGHHDGQRQHQMTGAVGDVAGLAVAVGAAAGQPFQIDAEDQHQQHAQPEGRDIIGRGAHPADEAVQGAVLEAGAEQGQGDGQHENQRVGQPAQQQGVAQQGQDHVHHRALVFERHAEVAVQHVAGPALVLFPDGAVQAQAPAGGVQLGAAHGLHGIAVIGLQGIAGRQARDVEDRQRERQQHQHQQRCLAQQGGYEGRHDILRSA